MTLVRVEDPRLAPTLDRASAGRVLRPRLAASILLLDRSAGPVRVLVGRRSKMHVFMPDVHVFPGGRRDPSDYRIRFNSDLPPVVLDRLIRAYDGRLSVPAARALALAAVRELHEETGLALGAAADPVLPSALPFRPELRFLRYLARAITPPKHVRRFDTHFFGLFCDEAEIDPSGFRDSPELEDLRWIPVADPGAVSIPEITASILDTVSTRLDADPSLGFEGGVPFFHVRHGRFIRDHL